MSEKLWKELRDGFETAFINDSYSSNLAYKPQFVYNDYKEGKKVFSTIETELEKCDEFIFSVAFVNRGGIAPFLQIFKELKNRGVKGKLLTTDYQYFTDPEALKILNRLGNIEIRMYRTNGGEGFHTKGYLFRNQDTYRYIVGSSNLTQSALMKNKEWNTRVISTENGEYGKSIFSEFEKMWKKSEKFTDFIDEYLYEYEQVKRQKKIAKQEETISLEQYTLQPNKMQKQFCRKLRMFQKDGETRALLISATGTGKTFASAFGVRDAMKHSTKTLFLAHREQILKQAKKSYQKVFGSKYNMVIFSGKQKNLDELKSADFVFAMITMMSKPEYLKLFEKNEFSTIVIDEVHHAAANSYVRIMDYFCPEFWLGMTATPDRPDGQDIYELFHHNIACDIRLQQAMEYDLLCPFHYYGITDLEVNGINIGDDNFEDFNRLYLDERVKHIISQIEYYGYSGDRVKGLMFCRTLKEAHELSCKLNSVKKEDGTFYRTLDLDGSSNDEERLEAINRLVDDSRTDNLDYILTCGIFNEGVDIPEVNQVVMLRPTESSIIFIQQLGRGLRKYENKEYVVIIDFIGNYTKSYLIPKALSGDRSGSKENLRAYVAEGTRLLPGCSSIHFEKVIKERIYKNIDQSNINKVEDIKYEYKCLRNKLGRIPSYYDFDEHNSIDMICIFNNENLRSYHTFLKKYEPDYEYKDALSDVQEEMLQCISQKIADGKRIEELELLKRLISYSHIYVSKYISALTGNYNVKVSEDKINNVVKVLSNDFLPAATLKKKYSRSIFVERKEDILLSTTLFSNQLKNETFVKLIQELLDYGIYRYKKNVDQCKYKDTDFVLYQKYSKSDVCRLLNWDKNINAQNIGGYFYDEKTKTLPVYITYKKDDEIADTQKYKDRFEGNSLFISTSKPGRGLAGEKRKTDSREVAYFYDKNTAIYLFLQKDKKETDYYFMGELHIYGSPAEVYREETKDTVLEFRYQLDVPVREDLYDYFTNEDIAVGDE